VDEGRRLVVRIERRFGKFVRKNVLHLITSAKKYKSLHLAYSRRTHGFDKIRNEQSARPEEAEGCPFN
jgi:hypothetical protein